MDTIKRIDYKNHIIDVTYDDCCDHLSPRNEYNIGKICIFHSRYSLGDPNPESMIDLFIEHANSEQEHKELLIEFLQETCKSSYTKRKEYLYGFDVCLSEGYYSDIISEYSEELEDCHRDLIEKHLNKIGIYLLPIYMYDHSGITINTTGFSCNWDSGQVGFIWAKYDEAMEKMQQSTNMLNLDTLYTWLNNEIEGYDRHLRGEYYVYYVYNPETEDQEGMLDCCGGFDDLEYCISEAKSYIDCITQ